MKKIILSVLVLSMAIASQAQETRDRKSERPRMMERKKHHGVMEMKQLNLTEEQKAKFKSQNESFRRQMEDLKKNENITVKEWKAKSENIRKEHKASLGNILTSDQKAQLKKMKIEGKVKHEEMGKKRSEGMKTRLGLSDEQSAKMESNRKQMGEQFKALRENKSLNEEQKRAQMKELMKKQKESLKSILTEEQIKKLKEKKHPRHEGERKRPEGEKRNPDARKTI